MPPPGLRGVALAALLAGLACAPSPRPPSSITVSVPYAIETLDPHRWDLAGQLALARHLYEPLVCKDGEMALRPCLAVRWYNPDALTWVFALRPGVRFHDRHVLEAADVVATFERLRREPALQVGVYARDVDTVRALGPLSVEIRTRRPVAVLLDKLAAVGIVPSGAPAGALDRESLGSGPYLVREWTRGSLLELERHRHHWAEAPAVQRVRFRFGRSAEEAQRDVLANTSQLAPSAAREIPEATGAPGLRALRQMGLFLKYLAFDLARERTPYVSQPRNPFLDRRVREAVHLSIDRRVLVERLPAYAVPAGQLVPPTVFGFVPGLPEPRRDTARARELLREAGLAGGFQVTLHARALVGEAAEPLRKMLAEVGIAVRVEQLEDDAFIALLADPGKRPSLFLNRYGCDSGDASDVLEAGLHTPDPERHLGAANAGGYSDPGLDRAVEAAAAQLDRAARRQALQSILARLGHELPWVPLYFDEDVYLVRAPFTFRPRADGYLLAAEIGVLGTTPGQRAP